MKKIIFGALITLAFTSPSLLIAEEIGPSSKETLVAQDTADLKRALYETQRDLQILNRRMDRFDEKINRIDREVQDLRIR